MKAFGVLLFVVASHEAGAALLTSLPGPDDQGGMIMPMFSISATAGTGSDPTAGALNVLFNPGTAPVLRTTEQWVPGSWYASEAAWTPDLGSTLGIGGTPEGSAGNGDRFNNQYGFTFMSMGSMMSANIPTGNSLAIRLSSTSSTALEAFNYSSAFNRWDQVFNEVGSQVLWNGSMWHNYFTLPASAAAGTYTATFEVFVASTEFTGGTGFAQYDPAALAAVKNPNFQSAFVTYQFTVVPEPSGVVLSVVSCSLLAFNRRRK